jgi:2-polyprenyl-6-hydroxyphenyl methylase/3-demethylubiquinone-9 3-methyltransferase
MDDHSAHQAGSMTTPAAPEVDLADRFQFGENWWSFLKTLDESRIQEAERSLSTMLGRGSLAGLTFLDVGCGSGLFSLAAVRLGAARVHSFDFDPMSVACAESLRQRFFPRSTAWTIEQGSAVDSAYVASLGAWDVVYSWGVLHHTGAMWRAIGNVAGAVRPGGTLFISIYNDQGLLSRFWTMIKRAYNTGLPARALITAVFVPVFGARGAARDTLEGHNPLRRYRDYRKTRGMSMFHDWRDWLGGYPFEVAKPEEIFEFVKSRGFMMERLKTCAGGLGCNEFVFHRSA